MFCFLSSLNVTLMAARTMCGRPLKVTTSSCLFTTMSTRLQI